MLKLVRVDKHEEETLHHLMQFYIYEFAFYKNDISLEADGTYKRFDLRHYWQDTRYHPFFIKRKDELIGFALIAEGNEQEPNQIEEFHIIRKYTGRGLGKQAACLLFEMFRGHWRITQIEANTLAQVFWRSAIGSYTGGNFTETTDEKNRTVQEFCLP
ncbi:hypothetical protein A8F94_21820 [Bacillus sp. FJAT-27225]|uniref:GNAT family N-acetyltransferase n=1 Tax=Bacillus sp. FJAT-27225 TaxID=1743144 RepID=UPI00080C2E3C|nr:GNAT family N-acetyltransferase [Bacillus sp. FJAT-27225]OCA81517.1 hypothetical protein A8F94_21820 [Bacillus sp. FJAT-27225]